MKLFKTLFGMLVILGTMVILGSIGGCDANKIGMGKCLVTIIVGINFCIIGSFGIAAENYIHKNMLKARKRYNDNLKATIAYMNIK